MIEHLIKRDWHCRVMPLDDHPQGIADQQNLDTGLLSEACRGGVVRCEHDNGDTLCFVLLEITHTDPHCLHSLP